MKIPGTVLNPHDYNEGEWKSFFSLSVVVVLVSFTNLLIGDDKMVFFLVFTAQAVNAWLKMKSWTAQHSVWSDKICYSIFGQIWRCIHFSNNMLWCKNVDQPPSSSHRYQQQQLNHHLITFRLLLMKRPAKPTKITWLFVVCALSLCVFCALLKAFKAKHRNIYLIVRTEFIQNYSYIGTLACCSFTIHD